MDGLVIKMNTSGFEVLNLVNKNKQTKKNHLLANSLIYINFISKWNHPVVLTC